MQTLDDDRYSGSAMDREAANELQRDVTNNTESFDQGVDAPREESPTEGTAIRSLLCRAALRGWRRGRRNQDPAQEEIADDLLLESGAAPRDGEKEKE